MRTNEGEMHVIAALGAIALSSALVVPTVWFAKAKGDHAPPLAEMEVIEASLAMKRTPKKQPQKKTQAKQTEVKPEGISRDDKKVVDQDACKQDSDCPAGKACERGTCKTPTKVAKTDETDPLAKYRREVDDETATGPETSAIGDFNDNARGFAEESKGHPYFQELAADFVESFAYPKILEGPSATGCLQLLADGTIKKIKVDPKSGEATLDDAVERALKLMQKARQDAPKPPPIELLKQATTRWICFNTGTLQRTE